MNINVIADAHYNWVDSMGWHNKTDLESLALIASEVGEAVQECRGEEPTEKLPEECADIILRTLDLMVSKGYPVEETLLAKMRKNKEEGNKKIELSSFLIRPHWTQPCSRKEQKHDKSRTNRSNHRQNQRY